MPWIEANGASLRYASGGAGKKTVVLVHEAGGCLESYDEAAAVLEQSLRVLRYDQRGFGFSEKVRALTFDIVVADLAALLDALAVDAPVCLAGCAMGADFATGFAARHPARVEKLVLASPLAGSNAGRSGPMLQRAQLVEHEGVRASMQASHERSYPENLRALDRERFRRYQARWVCNTPASFAAQARAVSELDLTEDYRRIRCPTLVIGAKHDALRPPQMAEQVAREISGARYSLAETGHFMNLQTPELFAQTLLAFFQDS